MIRDRNPDPASTALSCEFSLYPADTATSNQSRVTNHAVLLRRGGEIGATPAGNHGAILIVERRFGGRILAAHADHTCFRDEVSGHRGLVKIYAHVYGRHGAAESGGNRVVGSDIDDRREYAAVGVAPVRIHHPFLAPPGLHFDALGVDFLHGEIEPTVERTAGNAFLQFLQRKTSFAHR